jgi:soluble lytic murein transglycosylase-like protein
MTHAALALLFLSQTHAQKLPTGLLSALCYVESNHKINVSKVENDGSNSLGVCEIKLGTARMMGFLGTEKRLMQPKNNIKYAAKYLNYQIHRYHGDIYKAIGAYNSGTYHQNRKHQAKNKIYIERVLKAWSRGK